MAVKSYQDSKDKYLKEKVDTFVLRVPKGKKDEIAAFAANRGMSLNGYITSLVFADMGVETDVATKAPAPKAPKASKPKSTAKKTPAKKAPAPKPAVAQDKIKEEPKAPKVIIIPADPEEPIAPVANVQEEPQPEVKKKRNMPSFLL